MKAEEMAPCVGKHVFLVIPGGRSVACDVLKVKDGRVYAIEVNCDDWPFKYIEILCADISYCLPADDVEREMNREHTPADPGQFVIASRPDLADEEGWWYASPADLFGALRGWLNDEDGLGRPLTAK